MDCKELGFELRLGSKGFWSAIKAAHQGPKHSLSWRPAPARLFERDDGSPMTVGTMLTEASMPGVVQSELQHCFVNMISVAQSLVDQTLKDGASLEEARKTLKRRLAAMGKAFDLLFRNDWHEGSLRETVRNALSLHTNFHERIPCDGPELALGSNAVLTLTLALHKLGTNAIKYGALSELNGSVDLFWKIIDGPSCRRLWMQWVEHDGPPFKS